MFTSRSIAASIDKSSQFQLEFSWDKCLLSFALSFDMAIMGADKGETVKRIQHWKRKKTQIHWGKTLPLRVSQAILALSIELNESVSRGYSLRAYFLHSCRSKLFQIALYPLNIRHIHGNYCCYCCTRTSRKSLRFILEFWHFFCEMMFMPFYWNDERVCTRAPLMQKRTNEL